jgi:hypothetical protein
MPHRSMDGGFEQARHLLLLLLLDLVLPVSPPLLPNSGGYRRARPGGRLAGQAVGKEVGWFRGPGDADGGRAREERGCQCAMARGRLSLPELAVAGGGGEEGGRRGR